MQKVKLCEQCAKEKGVTDPTGFALADLLLGLGNSTSADGLSSARKPVEDVTTCKRCGFTKAKFKKTGRLGCPDCYHVFSEGMEPLLKAMHKGTRHLGKVPERYLALHARLEKIGALRRELDVAVAEERFEEAARLRDLVNLLEREAEDPDRAVTQASPIDS